MIIMPNGGGRFERAKGVLFPGSSDRDPAVSFVGRSIVEIYQPTARESLALDRLVEPVAILPAKRSRFMAFIDSARTHADFTAGHFDPGRMAA